MKPILLALVGISLLLNCTKSDTMSDLRGEIAAEDKDPQTLAAAFAAIMAGTVYTSEIDSPWVAVASTTAVGATYPIVEVRQALNINADPPAGYIVVYSEAREKNFWTEMMDADREAESGDAARYRRLKATMVEKLTDLCIIRIGNDAIGGEELYIVGRTRSGKLVGVKTVLVET